MRQSLVTLLLLLIVLKGFSQNSILIKDELSGEVLKGVILTGVKEYSLKANGIIEIDPDALSGIDSIIVYKEGFEKLVIFPPFEEKALLLSPLNLDISEVRIVVNQTENNLRNATGSLAYRRAENLFMHHNPVFADQLNKIPGIYIQNGTNNTNRLTIRGIGSRTPYSSNRIRAWLEDLPLSDGNGVTLIEDIDPELISSVELIKGPAGALYGSGLGGILKINTIDIREKENGISFKSQFGSFGSESFSLGANYAKNNTGFRLFASDYSSDGYRENNSFRRNTLFLETHHQLKNTTLSLIVLYTCIFGEIPSSLDAETFLNSPEKAAKNWLNVEGYEKYHKLGISAVVKSLLGNNLSNKFSTNLVYKNPYEVRPFNILDDNNYSLSFGDRIKYYHENWMISAGADIFLENYQWETYAIEDKLPTTLINKFSDRKLQLNTGILATYKIHDRLILNGSLNLNYTSYRLTDLKNLQNPVQNYNFNPILSPSFGMNYTLNEHLNFYASAGQGFSPPSIEETLLPDGNVNIDLQPESGWMMEAGIRSSANKILWIDFSLYTMNVKNMLVTRRITVDQFMGINAGEVNYKGFEIQLISKPLQFMENSKLKLILNSAYSQSFNHFTDFTDDGIDYSGKQLPGIPAMNWNNEIELKIAESWRINFSHRFTGDQYISDDNTVKYGSFQLSNLSTSGRIYKSNRVSILINTGIRNLFNEHYASMLLVNAPSFGSSMPRFYYPGNPRNVYLGIRINLN
ncbi:MAG: TonB-dependent receptor [Bacteroidales bacterium]|nr:TonB-dependent receptor [Bacteroidales bacterium]